jgi:hypothetical protein
MEGQQTRTFAISLILQSLAHRTRTGLSITRLHAELTCYTAKYLESEFTENKLGSVRIAQHKAAQRVGRQVGQFAPGPR